MLLAGLAAFTLPGTAGFDTIQGTKPRHRQRPSFGGQNYCARVEGDEIRYGEQAMSPSQFANLPCSAA